MVVLFNEATIAEGSSLISSALLSPFRVILVLVFCICICICMSISESPSSKFDMALGGSSSSSVNVAALVENAESAEEDDSVRL